MELGPIPFFPKSQSLLYCFLEIHSLSYLLLLALERDSMAV